MEDLAKSAAASATATVQELRRLGKNKNGYFGETIDIHQVLRDCTEGARRHGWEIDTIKAGQELDLLALRRKGNVKPGQEAVRVYISAGIHGDEPAGPLAVCRLVAENAWPEGVGLWVCPCLNPTGFLANRRENAAGTDLNRQYLQPVAEEIVAHMAWVQQQPGFDFSLCLHEDWESHGFYVYELNPDNRESMAEAMVQAVKRVCPIDPSEVIEGRPAQGGIIRPNTDPFSRPQWPEAFFLIRYKTRLSYTLEAPSDFPLAARVDALVAAVNAAVRAGANHVHRRAQPGFAA